MPVKQKTTRNVVAEEADSSAFSSDSAVPAEGLIRSVIREKFGPQAEEIAASVLGIARGEGLSDALSVSSSRLTPKRSGGIITPGGAHSAVDIPGGAFGAGTTTDLSTPEFAGAMDRVRSAREQLKRTPYEKEARIDLGLAGALAAQSAAAGGSNGLVRKKADMRASGHVRRAADAAMLIREDLALAEERRRSLDALHLSEASSLMRALVAIDGEIADTGIADTGETAARRLALEGQLESALRRARFAEERLR